MEAECLCQANCDTNPMPRASAVLCIGVSETHQYDGLNQQNYASLVIGIVKALAKCESVPLQFL
jgi:hypothetical protein